MPGPAPSAAVPPTLPPPPPCTSDCLPVPSITLDSSPDMSSSSPASSSEQNLAPLLADCYQQASSQATYSFARGLILGQLSVILLLAACARWLLLDNPRKRRSLAQSLNPGSTNGNSAITSKDGVPSAPPSSSGASMAGSTLKTVDVSGGGMSGKPTTTTSTSGAALPPSSDAILTDKDGTRIIPPLGRDEDDIRLLSRLGYDVLHQDPESCGWLNVLLAQIIRKYRAEALVEERLLRTLSQAMNTETRPSFLGEVKITEFALGSDYPILHSVRVRPTEDLSSMRVEADFTFKDLLTLGVDTELLLNWPRALLASLPVSLVISLVELSGTILIEFTSEDSSFLSFSLAPSYHMDLQIRSLLGHRTKVKDLPKVSQLLYGRLQSWLESHYVHPRTFTIPLPTLWKEGRMNEREEDPSPSVSPNHGPPSMALSEGMRSGQAGGNPMDPSSGLSMRDNEAYNGAPPGSPYLRPYSMSGTEGTSGMGDREDAMSSISAAASRRRPQLPSMGLRPGDYTTRHRRPIPPVYSRSPPSTSPSVISAVSSSHRPLADQGHSSSVAPSLRRDP